MVHSPEVCFVLWPWCTAIPTASPPAPLGCPGWSPRSPWRIQLLPLKMNALPGVCSLQALFPCLGVFPLLCPKPDQCSGTQGPGLRSLQLLQLHVEGLTLLSLCCCRCEANALKSALDIPLLFKREQITWIVRGKLKDIISCFLEENGG